MPEGATVSPQRYLADTVAAAAAVSAFSDVLAEAGPVARRPVLLALHTRLDEAYDRAQAIADRIDNERLEDRRLESQRSRASGSLQDVVVAMNVASDIAGTGDAAAMKGAAARYGRAVQNLRELFATR